MPTPQVLLTLALWEYRLKHINAGVSAAVVGTAADIAYV